jgi:hypothetical protein
LSYFKKVDGGVVMGERDVDFAGDTYEEDDPYENEKKVASFFSVAKEQAARLAAQRYGTPEAANEAGSKFVTTFSEIAGGTAALYRTEVHIQGFNVRVSNVVTEQTDDGRCILTVDQDAPYVLAERYSEPTGMVYALNASIDQDESGYLVVPMMTFIDTEPDETVIQVNQYPVAHLSVTKYIIAPLQDSEFDIPVLEDLQRRRKVLSEVALKHREKPTELTTALTRITTAISNANDRTFTRFEYVDSFHTLAKLPEDANVDEMMDLFRGVMGSRRQISIEAVAYEGIDVEEPRKLRIIGTFLDIVPNQEALGVGEPTLIISSTKEGEEQLVYVPLSRIEEFSF